MLGLFEGVASRSRLDHLKGDREPAWWRGSSVFGSSEAAGDDWRTRLHMTDQGGMSRRFGPLSGSFGLPVGWPVSVRLADTGVPGGDVA